MKPLYRIITAKEAADLLGISERAVRQHCEKGNYKSRKANGTWLIDSYSLKSSK